MQPTPGPSSAGLTASAPAAAAAATPTAVPPTLTLTPTITLTPAPTATRTPVPCTESWGTVIEDSFVSKYTEEPFHYRVYLPPCYSATERRYPTLYIFHGLGFNMDDEQWDRMGIDEAENQGYAQKALPPMIIVMPNGNDADYGASYGPSDFPDVVTDELIPLIDSHYCTWAERDMRAIGGLSRGGFWAYWIAFNHPELFSRVGGHSPYFYEPIYPSEQNPNNIVGTAEGIEDLKMYIDNGGQGRDAIEVMPGVQRFIARLEARGIEVEYVLNPFGDHVEEYWAEHVAEYLSFYGADWPLDVEQYPSCHSTGTGG